MEDRACSKPANLNIYPQDGISSPFKKKAEAITINVNIPPYPNWLCSCRSYHSGTFCCFYHATGGLKRPIKCTTEKGRRPYSSVPPSPLIFYPTLLRQTCQQINEQRKEKKNTAKDENANETMSSRSVTTLMSENAKANLSTSVDKPFHEKRLGVERRGGRKDDQKKNFESSRPIHELTRGYQNMPNSYKDAYPEDKPLKHARAADINYRTCYSQQIAADPVQAVNEEMRGSQDFAVEHHEVQQNKQPSQQLQSLPEKQVERNLHRTPSCLEQGRDERKSQETNYHRKKNDAKNAISILAGSGITETVSPHIEITPSDLKHVSSNLKKEQKTRSSDYHSTYSPVIRNDIKTIDVNHGILNDTQPVSKYLKVAEKDINEPELTESKDGGDRELFVEEINRLKKAQEEIKNQTELLEKKFESHTGLLSFMHDVKQGIWNGEQTKKQSKDSLVQEETQQQHETASVPQMCRSPTDRYPEYLRNHQQPSAFGSKNNPIQQTTLLKPTSSNWSSRMTQADARSYPIQHRKAVRNDPIESSERKTYNFPLRQSHHVKSPSNDWIQATPARSLIRRNNMSPEFTSLALPARKKSPKNASAGRNIVNRNMIQKSIFSSEDCCVCGWLCRCKRCLS